jgi:hypothetical protein
LSIVHVETVAAPPGSSGSSARRNRRKRITERASRARAVYPSGYSP